MALFERMIKQWGQNTSLRYSLLASSDSRFFVSNLLIEDVVCGIFSFGIEGFDKKRATGMIFLWGLILFE